MGMGNPMGMGIPWESLFWNGNSHIAHNGNGNNAAGMEIAHF